jgi:hypothetical protein
MRPLPFQSVACAGCFAVISFSGATTLCRAMASPAVMAITKSSIPELADFVSRPLQDHHPALSEAVGHNSRLFKK